MSNSKTSVLIIGAGPAGLVAAGLLAIKGVKCVLLEKHEKVSLHPRAVGFTTRTMEIFNELGVADKVPQTTTDFRLRRIQVESLAAIAQDKLDTILRNRIEELKCDVRYGHRMLTLLPAENASDLTTVQVQDPSGKEYTIVTQYLLGADGHKSMVRELLNIHMTGRGHISTLQSMLFRAPALDKYLEHGFHQFAIKQPENDFFGFMTTYNDSRWVLMGQDEKIRSDDELRKVVLSATGVPNLDYEFVTTGIWNLAARVADSFSFPINDTTPRIFLLGDAAHTLPPTRGGYGANTGISDAHNIAWKLASVLSGRSSAALLRSYDAERRPVAWLRHQQIFAGPDYARYRVDGTDYGLPKDPVAMELGQVYQSDIIINETDRPEAYSDVLLAMNPDDLQGLPGSRAPHLWLGKQDETVSTLKLFQNRWTVVSGNAKWISIVGEVSKVLGFDIQIIYPGKDGITEKERGMIVDKFGLTDSRASLIRPDGFIAWRSKAGQDDTSATQHLVNAYKCAAAFEDNKA